MEYNNFLKSDIICKFNKDLESIIYHLSRNKYEYNNDLYNTNDKLIEYNFIKLKKKFDDNNYFINIIDNLFKNSINNCVNKNILIFIDLIRYKHYKLFIKLLNEYLFDNFEDKSDKYKNIIILNYCIFKNEYFIYNVRNGKTFKKIVNIHNNIKKVYNDTYFNINYEHFEKINVKNNYVSCILRYKDKMENENKLLNNQWWIKLYYNIPSCANRRLKQFTGSCWLNTILNTIFLNDDLTNYLYEINKVEMDMMGDKTLIDIYNFTTYDILENNISTKIINLSIYASLLIHKNIKITDDLYKISYMYGNLIYEYKSRNNEDYKIYKKNLLFVKYFIKKYILDKKLSLEKSIKLMIDGVLNNEINKIYNLTNDNLYKLDRYELREINIILLNLFKCVDVNLENKDINKIYIFNKINKVINDSNLSDEIKSDIIYFDLINFNLKSKLLNFLIYYKNNDYKISNLTILNNKILYIFSILVKCNFDSRVLFNYPYESDYLKSIYNLLFNIGLFNEILEDGSYTTTISILIYSILFNDNIMINGFSDDENKLFKFNIDYFTNNKIKIVNMNENNYRNYEKYNRIKLDYKNYKLASSIISIKEVENEIEYKHVITGFICNNKYFIYDSNNYLDELDWINPLYFLSKYYNNLYNNLLYLLDNRYNRDEFSYLMNEYFNVINENIIVKNNLYNNFIELLDKLNYDYDKNKFNKNYIIDILENILSHNSDYKILKKFIYNICNINNIINNYKIHENYKNITENYVSVLIYYEN